LKGKLTKFVFFVLICKASVHASIMRKKIVYTIINNTPQAS